MTVTDLTVVGGGPAGLATAIAACRAGLGVVLVEPVALGGQLVNAATLRFQGTIQVMPATAMGPRSR